MRKSATFSIFVVMIGVLLLTMLAYRHSLTVSKMYDDRMREDIQACTQQLTQAGVPSAQAAALQSALNDVNHHTLSFVTSETDSVIGTMGFMGVIIMSAVLGMAARTGNEPKTQ